MADYYMDLYGVMSAPKWVDVEKAGGIMPSQYQVRSMIDRIRDVSPGKPGYYSNYPRTKDIGNPSWIKDYPVWWAQYPLYWTGLGWSQFRTFEKFFEKKPWWTPTWAAKLGISPIIHQFTEKGDAQNNGANAYTNDPKWKVGIKSADFNAGLVSYDEYYNIRFSPYFE